MKSDIDRLMQENGVDAILVTGAGENNPAMVYLTGGIEVTRADLIKIADETPVLFHSPIERDGAVKAGARLISYAEFSFAKLLQEAGGNSFLASAYRYRDMFNAIGLCKGTVAVYGETDLGRGYSALAYLSQIFPGINFQIKPEQDILRKARATKDEDEIKRIRRMGELTVEIVGDIVDFLSGHSVSGGNLVKSNSEPLTINDVKTRLRLLLAERDIQAENTIFAIGRDAGVPHNMGNPQSILRTGETIIFDAYFQESGGGYWHDFTRTWCLGEAPERAERLFDEVKLVHSQVAQEVEAGTSFYQYHQIACEMFEEMGHKTLESDPGTHNGYVHGLGHGVGLEIHELPAANADIPENVLKPGMVITIEPGLYVPDEGCGVRIEDTYWIDSDGKAKRLVEYPWDLVIPLKGKK